MEIECPFRFKQECFQFPIVTDQERREIFQKYLLPQLENRTFRAKLKKLLAPSTSQHETITSEETLVINIRSGFDIFRQIPAPHNEYIQPPLSFYKHIIKKHNYRKALIVTEPDRANPVIPALLNTDLHCEIRLKQRKSIQDDISTILNASHLIAAHSTFTWCLGLMSKNLKVVHQPETFYIRGVSDFESKVYRIKDYIEVGEWNASDSQLALMLGHSEELVRELLPADFPEGGLVESMLN